MKATCTYSYRLDVLEVNGFVQKKGCITNDKYSFLYHQIDRSEMTDDYFEKFIRRVKAENLIKL